MNDAAAQLHPDRRALVFAPRGRDAAVLAQVLGAAALSAHVCPTLAALGEALPQGAGLALVTEEELATPEVSVLARWLDAQAPWSDLPVIVLATKQAGRRSAPAMERLHRLGNVVLLERPLNAETLVSAARSALRSRERQYQARWQLELQARIGQENERLYRAEREALREAANVREALELALDGERSARLQAEQASRVKDEFLATLSHELRTPLSAILGWAHLLKLRAADSPELMRGIETIDRNARAQTRLVDDLLDMSRINAGNLQLELQPLMPAALLDAVIDSLEPAAEAKHLRIERAIDASVGPVSADAQRFPQILWNLMVNAIKFTPAHGSIRVSLEGAGNDVVLRVKDSGEGIAPDFLPFIFDRFLQADGSTTRRHGGLGLGLAIVRHLVELHGGRVEADSAGRGQGATFSVRLPLDSTSARLAGMLLPPRAATPPALAAEASPLAGVQVVLVDDEPDGLEMLESILTDHGAAVRAASSASEALVLLGDAPADLLISDIGMPQMDGYQLLRSVRQQGHALPAIALTAFARSEDRARVLAAGFLAHLAKPVEPSDLLGAVARAMGR